MHIKELPDMMTQIVLLCEKLGMIGFENLAVDGEKIHGNASYRKSMNRERLDARYKKVKNGIEKLLNQEPCEDLPEADAANGKYDASKFRIDQTAL